MTPPAATAAARSHARPQPRTAPRAPRRVSGPARVPARNGLAGGAVLAPPLGLRIAQRVAALPDARLLDRLARGRGWIGILAVGLVGIVFLQISLLKLNTGISRAVETGQTLERQNTALKSELSALAGGERIQESAAAMGFVLPATGQPRFLDARRATAERAAAGITKPAPIQQLPLGMIPPAQGGTAGTAPDPVVAVTTPPAAGTATTPATATPATTAPATTAPAAAAPAATPAATATPAAAAPVSPAPAAGGATAAPQG